MWHRFKKAMGLLLTAVMVLELALPTMAQAEVTNEKATREIEGNLLSGKNANFEGATGGTVDWWYGSGSAVLSLSDDAKEGSHSLLVEPPTAGAYVGAGNNLSSELHEGVTYQYSFYAKLVADAPGVKVSLGLNRRYSDNSYATSIIAAETDEDYTFSSTEWTKVTGTFTFPSEDKTVTERHLVLSSDSTTAFMVDDLRVIEAAGGGAPVSGDNILEDPQFTAIDSPPWYAYANGATYSVGTNTTDTDTIGAGYGMISGRTQNWECIGQDITSKVENNSEYHFSFYAKLSDDYGDQTRQMQLCTTKQDSTDSEEQYDKLKLTDGKATVSATEWTKIEGTVEVAWTGTLQKLVFKISEQGDPISDGVYGSYYVANAQMYKVAKPVKTIETDIPDLKDTLTGDGFGLTGVCLPQAALGDQARMDLVYKHYNAITCENEMKPESFLGDTPTIGSDGYPELNFAKGDAIMDAIKAHNDQQTAAKDKILVRGHTLVWHSQTPEWFFHEDYDTSKDYVSKTVMLQRMDNYIHQVMTHYEGNNSPYKGMFYAWDVVNEAVNDSDGGLRNQGSSWYSVFKSDEFIRMAFVYANKYAPDDLKLFYNDYNDSNDVKSKGICKLLTAIKNTDGARIDGMGMQSHHDMDAPTPEAIATAIRAYSGIVKEVQLTELDVKSSLDYNGTNKNAEDVKMAYRYKAIYDKLVEVNKEPNVNITAITFWGTDDGNSWLNDFVNRPVSPLLFDSNYKAKPAFWGIVNPDNLEPAINQIIALNAKNFDSVQPVSFEKADVKAQFATIWEENALKVKVTVTDPTVDAKDAVTAYVDFANSRKANATTKKVVVKRADAKATATGYEAVVTVDAEGLKTLDTLGMDIKVTDGNNEISWNDLTNKQDTSSKYYGEVQLKPFMSIAPGSVTIDGKTDDIWNTVDPVKLGIVGSSAKASAEAKLLWDDNALYVRMQVKDATLDKSSANAYEQDSVEVFIDENNSKAGAYEPDDKQYRINFENEKSFNGTKCLEENVNSATAITDDGYIVEAAFKWTDVTPEIGALLGLDLQINDAENGSRIGTVNWYDESGTGYNNPGVFGTVELAAEAQPEDTYKITATAEDGKTSYNFGSLEEAYAKAPEAQTFTITNTGTGPVVVNDPVSEEDSSFTVSSLDTTELNPGESVTFTVQPKLGLAVGNYEENLSIDSAQGASATVTVKFSVTEKKATKPNKPADKDDSEAPKTGDSTPFVLWFSLLAVAGGGLTVFTVRRRRIARK